MREIYISRLELQRWPLEFVIYFYKIYSRHLVVRYTSLIPFGDHVIQILFIVMKFQNELISTVKNKNPFLKQLLS